MLGRGLAARDVVEQQSVVIIRQLQVIARQRGPECRLIIVIQRVIAPPLRLGAGDEIAPQARRRRIGSAAARQQVKRAGKSQDG